MVVADGALARFFTRQRPEMPWVEIDALKMTLRGQLRHKRLTGQIAEGVDHGPLVRPAHENRKNTQERHFLGRVAGHINAAEESHAVRELILVAPPHALGILRDHLSAQTLDRVVFELGKDLTRAKIAEIDERVNESQRR
jgi:protein required for attachment to host cells